MTMRHPFIAAVLAYAVLVAGCGGGSSGESALPKSTVNPPDINVQAVCPEPTPATPVDDWVTLGHDSLSSGCQPQNIGVTTSNVSKLKLHWKYSTGDQIIGGPVVANGSLYTVTLNNGIVFALQALTGKVLWTTQLGGPGVEVRMVPAYDHGMLFVGTHNFVYDTNDSGYDPVASNLYALDAATGKILWQARVPGPIRATPAVVNGKVFVGVAGGDTPTCTQGGVREFDEKTGAPGWIFNVDPVANDGGSVWSPISFDGTHLYFGTGNTCVNSVLTANGIVALDPASGSVIWQYNTYNPTQDYDVGSGVVILHGEAIALSKSGTLFYLDQNSGGLTASQKFGTSTFGAGYSTPATDGRYVFVRIAGYGGAAATSAASSRRTPSFFGRVTPAASSGGGALVALDLAGNVIWTHPTQSTTSNSVAINAGVVYADLDNQFVALSTSNGQTLWSYAMPAPMQASPAVVPSGIYTADQNGTVYAFGL